MDLIISEKFKLSSKGFIAVECKKAEVHGKLKTFIPFSLKQRAQIKIIKLKKNRGTKSIRNVKSIEKGSSSNFDVG